MALLLTPLLELLLAVFSLGHSSVALRLYRGSAPPWIRRSPKIGLSRDVAQLQVDLTLEEPHLSGSSGRPIATTRRECAAGSSSSSFAKAGTSPASASL